MELKINEYKELVGNIFYSVTREKNNEADELIFNSKNGKSYKFFHSQECCEDVYIESIVGDLKDLENTEILKATSSTKVDYSNTGSTTWTFYTFATINGFIDVRWVGNSNGCYSETADFKEIEKQNSFVL